MRFRTHPIRLLVVLIPLMALLAGPTHAGRRDHEDGFFLRLSAGGGAAQTELDIPGFDTKLSGAASNVNIAIGGIVAPNLALHATLFGWLVDEPDIDINGLSVTVQNDLSLSGFGGGLTYYAMPVNIYLSGSIGAGSLTLELPGGDANSETGVMMDFTVGKEWWVGNRWGIGVAGALGLHSIPEKDVSENWTGADFAIRFTATFN
jgi:hypothetical protein